MAHSVLFPLSFQIVSNTHFCHFAWQLRLFRFLKWKSNGILKILCEMMKKCVAFFFSCVCTTFSIFLSTQTLSSYSLCGDRVFFFVSFRVYIFHSPHSCWTRGEMTKTVASSQYQYPCILVAKNMNNMYCKLNYLYIECCLF